MKQPKGDRDRGLIPMELAREIMAGNVIDGKTGKVISYTDALLDMEYAKHPSTLERIPASNKQKSDNLPYVVMPKRKPQPQESDAWKLGCSLTIGAILVVLYLVMQI